MPPDQQNEVVEALALLDPDVWAISSRPGIVAVVRRWTDDSTDSILLFSPESAHARREDSAGRTVWKCVGAAVDVVQAMLALAKPKDADAPSTPLPDGTVFPL